MRIPLSPERQAVLDRLSQSIRSCQIAIIEARQAADEEAVAYFQEQTRIMLFEVGSLRVTNAPSTGKTQ